MYFPTSPNTEGSHGVHPDPFQISTLLQHSDFTHEFCYLGSIFTTDLRDDRDIAARIRKTTQQVRTLPCFFRNKAIDVFTKYQTSWEYLSSLSCMNVDPGPLKSEHLESLVFFLRSIRLILGIFYAPSRIIR
jgi:hypothetical protein